MVSVGLYLIGWGEGQRSPRCAIGMTRRAPIHATRPLPWTRYRAECIAVEPVRQRGAFRVLAHTPSLGAFKLMWQTLALRQR